MTEQLTRYQQACILADAANAAQRRRRQPWGLSATPYEEDLAWALEEMGYAIVKVDD